MNGATVVVFSAGDRSVSIEVEVDPPCVAAGDQHKLMIDIAGAKTLVWIGRWDLDSITESEGRQQPPLLIEPVLQTKRLVEYSAEGACRSSGLLQMCRQPPSQFDARRKSVSHVGRKHPLRSVIVNGLNQQTEVCLQLAALAGGGTACPSGTRWAGVSPVRRAAARSACFRNAFDTRRCWDSIGCLRGYTGFRSGFGMSRETESECNCYQKCPISGHRCQTVCHANSKRVHRRELEISDQWGREMNSH